MKKRNAKSADTDYDYSRSYCKTVKKDLAELAGVPEDELVITRNTTESLGTVIHGLDFAAGDEAVMCNHDYGSMLEQFRQEGKRRGLKCVEVDVPL